MHARHHELRATYMVTTEKVPQIILSNQQSWEFLYWGVVLH